MADIELTFDKPEESSIQNTEIPTLQVDDVASAVEIASEKFSNEEIEQIKEFAEKIDLKDTNAVIGYGSNAQDKVSNFAGGALESVRNKDMGDAGALLSNLLVEIKHGGEEKKGFFGKVFSGGAKKIDEIKTQLRSTESNVNKLVDLLNEHQKQLLDDISLMDELYEKNREYFKEVSMYIEAGKMKLEMARKNELPELQDKAAKSGNAEDTQEAQDYADLIDRFEKKLYDLEISRTVCLQSAPEIRMIQNSDTIMSEKIQSTIVNVIPMWKTQMVLALNNFHTQAAIKAQNEVTDATNEMMAKNAAMLHQNAVDTAKASERGIVDIETLQNTNNELMAALDEIQKIQEEGKIARANAEKELNNIETTLKEKLKEITASAGKDAAEIEASRKSMLGM